MGRCEGSRLVVMFVWRVQEPRRPPPSA